MLPTRKNSLLLFVLVIACPLMPDQLVLAQETDADKITFDDHVGPLFRTQCSSCHNPNKKSGDLDVTNYTALMTGGGSGAVITPGDSADSYLFDLITYQDTPEMPPSQQIPDNEIELVRNWIDGGALENKGSTAAPAKPKVDMAIGDSAMTKPEIVPMPGRLPLQPGLTTARPGAVTAMAVSPWAPLVAIAAPGQIVLYNTQNLELIGVLPTPPESDSPTSAHSMRFSRNGSLLIAGVGRAGASGRALLWDVATGELIATLGDELDSILAIDISPDHSRIAIGGTSKVVKVLSTADGSLIYEIKKHTDWVTAIEFSPDGKYLATGDRSAGLYLWRAAGGAEHQTLSGHKDSISGVSWRADAKAIVSAGEDGFATLWQADSGKELKFWETHGGGSTSVEFTREGNIATTGRDNAAKVWKPDGTAIHNLEAMSDVGVAVRFCNATQRIISADWAGMVRVYNAADGTPAGELSPNPPVLETRLAAANQQVQQHDAHLQPLLLQQIELETKLNEQRNTLLAAITQRDETGVQLETLANEISAAKQQLQSTKASREEWAAELKKKNEAIPLVKESHANAVAALGALPGDAELQQTVNQMSDKLVQIEARKTELQPMVARSNETQQATRKSMREKQAAQAPLKKSHDELNQKVSAMETEVGTLNDSMTALMEQVNAATGQVESSRAEVVRWTDEISFANSLKELRLKLAKAELAVAGKAGSVGVVQEKLAAMQAEIRSELQAAQQQQQEAQSAADSLKQQILELKKN